MPEGEKTTPGVWAAAFRGETWPPSSARGVSVGGSREAHLERNIWRDGGAREAGASQEKITHQELERKAAAEEGQGGSEAAGRHRIYSPAWPPPRRADEQAPMLPRRLAARWLQEEERKPRGQPRPPHKTLLPVLCQGAGLGWKEENVPLGRDGDNLDKVAGWWGMRCHAQRVWQHPRGCPELHEPKRGLSKTLGLAFSFVLFFFFSVFNSSRLQVISVS